MTLTTSSPGGFTGNVNLSILQQLSQHLLNIYKDTFNFLLKKVKPMGFNKRRMLSHFVRRSQISYINIMNAFQKSLMAALVLLSFATLFADPNPSSQAPTEIFEGNTKDWKSRRVYQIVTDRFNDNRGQPCAFLKDYCGGTFQGITNKLDYIKGMGFDAIYISPSINSMHFIEIFWAETIDNDACANRHSRWLPRLLA